MTRRPQLRTTGVAGVLCLVLATAACSGDDEPDARPGPTGSPGSPGAGETVATMPTTTRLGTVAGDLPKAQRKKVRADVSSTVDRWIDAAFVGGEYPRSGFGKAYPGFTKGAKRQARRQGELMSNSDIGGQISGVDVTQRRVVVDAVAHRGRAAGATARVRLAFTTSGEVEQSVVVRGRLFLTRHKQGWRIFGFDVAKGVR